MSPNTYTKGFALPAAIFVLVVIAAMVTTMARISGTQSQLISQSYLASSAYWAAVSGMEWRLNQLSSNDHCTNNIADVSSTNTLTIGQFTVVTTCTCDQDSDGNCEEYNEATSNLGVPPADNQALPLFSLSATATTTGQTITGPDYAYSAVQADILWKAL